LAALASSEEKITQRRKYGGRDELLTVTNEEPETLQDSLSGLKQELVKELQNEKRRT